MIDQIITLTTRIFPYAFFNYQVFFVFHNIANHVCYIENALLAKKTNLDVSEKQFRMRNRFNNMTK